jgi:hypothetical protein
MFTEQDGKLILYVFARIRSARRKALGDIPSLFVKARSNERKVPNPVRHAISRIGRLEFVRSSTASLWRLRARYSVDETP